MRASLQSSSSLICFILMAACQSVPDGAPEEFHLAKASIQQADEADVDDILPKTVERAEKTLDEALDLYEKSEDDDIDRNDRQGILQSASKKATEARTMAEQALALNNQVLSWDENIEQHQSYQKLSQEVEQLRQQVAQNQAAAQSALASQSQQGQPQKAASGMSNVQIKGPVAFFGVGETQVKGRFTETLAGLAEALKADTNRKVTLMGFADSSGDVEKNLQLSRERAESVASILRSMGVKNEQITIDARGVDNRTAARTPAERQLERRVEAFLAGSETEPMTTAR